MNRELTAEEIQALEELIDRTSVSDVLEALAGICGEKADHVHANYDDRPLAREWNRASEILFKASGKVGV